MTIVFIPLSFRPSSERDIGYKLSLNRVSHHSLAIPHPEAYTEAVQTLASCSSGRPLLGISSPTSCLSFRARLKSQAAERGSKVYKG